MTTRDKNQISVCNNLHDVARKDRNFVYQAVTVDETWVYGYDAKTITSQIFKE
jgi:hypothetical protein